MVAETKLVAVEVVADLVVELVRLKIFFEGRADRIF